ncbi:MAG: iron-containing alcohol dehydrogenase [Planctomycetaceae bacterium]|jgi:alcohol dehydrogenase|nr:iron-containing alcohol dehydrogenase [Planctomycetaceae bacterium]MBT6155085.1 iron-containing alcohol dehydrogenase [Planctomycetaceae bacterium]MBT6483399.1 iron-containing alcohol dehydrogenase [Planctomycetaceae bacterium]MBT6493806.1 iron-containing alcohol dehydrogenase [Planctomycetaceae bacterium]
MQGKSSLESQLELPAASDLPASFDFQPRTRVVFGPGSVEQLGTLATEIGGRRVLLVTDKGVEDAGHGQHGVDALTAAGLDVIVFDDVHSNPTTEDVDRGLEVAKEADIDLIVGLGGGSSMDCAKGINFLLTNDGRMQDYWGIGKATKPMLPMIAVPTTAGTGSEAQSFALIADAETHMKMACGDKKAACCIAILDPDLTVSMPRMVTATTGIDAISHAIETYVTVPRNTMSQLFSRRAWQLLSQGFPRVLTEPDDVEARGCMLLGAHLAGAAIENSMLGATHALANPLSAHFEMTHGIAIGLMLPHVIRYNAEVVGRLYGVLAADAGLCEADDPDAPFHLAGLVESLVADADCPTSFADCDVDSDLIPTMAEEAAAQWTGRFNPRPVTAGILEDLYRCAETASDSGS